MRIPKWFEKWFHCYGLMDDRFCGWGDICRAKRIAWRAYKRGISVERKKQLNEIYKIRPYADCYKRVCDSLDIKGDILGYIKNLKRRTK